MVNRRVEFKIFFERVIYDYHVWELPHLDISALDVDESFLSLRPPWADSKGNGVPKGAHNAARLARWFRKAFAVYPRGLSKEDYKEQSRKVRDMLFHSKGLVIK